MSHFTQGHALLIGIGTYQHMADVNVPITVADAKAMQTVLSDENLCGYPANQITPLHNESTTRDALLAALDNLAAATKPESTVLLYYAGHGEYGTDGNYYLSTHDSRREGAKIVAGTGLSDAELLTKLRAIPAKRLLVIFNACHAGALSPDLSIAPPIDLGINPPPEQTLDAVLATGEGRIIMTACRPQQKSRVGHGQLTLFTQALVEGLRGQGVANRNGYISAFGLYEHLYETVKERAGDLGYQQDPELTVLRGVGPFPVARYRGATTLGLFDDQEPLSPDTAVRAITPERSRRMLRLYEQSLSATNTGSGAIAQGPGAVAAGERGIAIGGNVTGSNLSTGDNTRQIQTDRYIERKVETGGGTYVEGNVDTKGGDFVGRDKRVTRHTAFDQSGQTVLGGQTNIEGGVHTAGGIFNSNPGAIPAQPALATQLRNLQNAIAQAAKQGLIDDDTAIDVDGALRKAINQADKPTPDRQAIQTHLATARDKLAPIPAASGLVNAINAISHLLA